MQDSFSPQTSSKRDEFFKEKLDDKKIAYSHEKICKGEVFSLIINELSNVKKHVHNTRIQASTCNDDATNVTKRLLHIDVAMSCSCKYQNEVSQPCAQEPM